VSRAKYNLESLPLFGPDDVIGADGPVLYTGTRAGAICGAALDQPTIGRSWIDLENGIFYRQAIGRRKEKNKQQTPVRLPP
jgi:hypothetical protein